MSAVDFTEVYNSLMGKLLLLFILVPAAELAILIELGSRIGTVPTLGLIAVTGVLGAALARWQGLGVLRSAQEQMRRGELPAGSIADGMMILTAAALLLTPGVLTDAFGFLLLLPQFRTGIKALAIRRLRRAVEENRVQVQVSGFDFPGVEGPPYRRDAEAFDVEFRRGDDGRTTKYDVH